MKRLSILRYSRNVMQDHRLLLCTLGGFIYARVTRFSNLRCCYAI